MSLGSVSGEQTEDDPEIAAVEKAVKHGTAAVISAGNSGTSTSNQEGNNKDFYHPMLFLQFVELLIILNFFIN